MALNIGFSLKDLKLWGIRKVSWKQKKLLSEFKKKKTKNKRIDPFLFVYNLASLNQKGIAFILNRTKPQLTKMIKKLKPGAVPTLRSGSSRSFLAGYTGLL